MRRLRNIFAILALLSTASCAVDNIDVPTSTTPANDVVTVIGRMTRFDDKDVTTRGVKDENEAKLTSMAVAIFPVNADGTALSGNCVHWQYTDNQAELLFEINRSGIGFTQNARYAMYVFCNMPELEDFGIGSTLEAMLAETQKVDGIDIPANGFPMMGSLGDTFSTTFDKDNQILILSPTKNNQPNGELLAPTVAKPKADGNGWDDPQTQTLLTIPMKAMYAKVNFSIEVRPDQTIEGHYSPQFELKGYTVNNVPSKVDFSYVTNSDSDVSDSGSTLGVSGNTVASGANRINFTFYLPERYLEPTTKAADYAYPFKKDGKIRGEDSVYMQRFKSKLIDDSKKATNIVISGRYRDHQNHYWDVDYTIYLGEDNYGDFNIKRNSEYHNYVTIRGIQNSDDMSDNTNGIAIDHRVNVERTQPAIISLRREVLLDSHFEVRPLRIRKNDVENIPTDITHVRVEVVKPETTNWMRIERSFGDGTVADSPTNASGDCIYINEDANSASYGKRRYFTYNLVDGNTPGQYDYSLVESTEVILPITDATECCWIYVDECTEVGDAVRSGIVKVSYGSYDGTTFTPANNANYPDVNYIINQRKLFQVTYDDPETTAVENRIYNIEYEEEYLHNFDADDNYGETEFEGMEWGLEGTQLSYDHKALLFDTSYDWINGIIDWIKSNTGVDPKYDFYVPKHDTSVSSQAKKRDFRGYVFSNEIITTVNGGQKDANGNAYDSNPDNDINILQLDEQPESAIEYCYNKNKRNNKGEVVWQNTDGTYDQSQLNWYLPAIDEMEDIVMSKYGNGLNTYARFIEFQSQFYWSSQPSYIRNYAHYNVIISLPGEYYYDDIDFARSTSVWYDATKKEFESSPSGVTSYYNAVHIWNEWFSTRYEYIQSGTYNGHSLGSIIRESGNQPRTEKNRVRCVRKSQYTNTSTN